MLELNRSIRAANPRVIEWERKGYSLSYLASEEKILGVFAFSDPLKESALETITQLQQMGLNTVMLTGDHERSAMQVAKNLGIKHVRWDVLPEGKILEIQNIKAQSGGLVGMVGDGMNDAPALSAADVGIAFSTGAEVAMHISSITLMRSDLRLVVEAIDISRRTYTKIRENLFWAFFYNCIGIPAAAFGLLTPMWAGAAMAMSSVSVVTNALLLRRK